MIFYLCCSRDIQSWTRALDSISSVSDPGERSSQVSWWCSWQIRGESGAEERWSGLITQYCLPTGVTTGENPSGKKTFYNQRNFLVHHPTSQASSAESQRKYWSDWFPEASSEGDIVKKIFVYLFVKQFSHEVPNKLGRLGCPKVVTTQLWKKMREQNNKSQGEDRRQLRLWPSLHFYPFQAPSLTHHFTVRNYKQKNTFFGLLFLTIYM